MPRALAPPLLCALLAIAVARPASASDSSGVSPAPQAAPEAAAPQSNGIDTQFLLTSIGPPAGAPLSGEALERRTHEVASVVRCPVCQGAAVADSPSTMAQNMKAETRDLLARGYDQEQILRYFELSYGEFVRLDPKADGFNVLLWAMPLLVLIGGLGAAMVALRRLRPTKVEAAVRPAADPLPADPELARHLLRVRERAYGWSGGVRPKGEAGGSHG